MKKILFRAWGPDDGDGDVFGAKYMDNPDPRWVDAFEVSSGLIEIDGNSRDSSIGSAPGQYRIIESLENSEEKVIFDNLKPLANNSNPVINLLSRGFRASLRGQRIRPIAVEMWNEIQGDTLNINQKIWVLLGLWCLLLSSRIKQNAENFEDIQDD